MPSPLVGMLFVSPVNVYSSFKTTLPPPLNYFLPCAPLKFLYLFMQYLLGACFVAGTVAGSGDTKGE